jgi:hypothetical protein
MNLLAQAMETEALTGLLETYLEYGDEFSIPSAQGGAVSDWYNIEIPTGLAFSLWPRNARIAFFSLHFSFFFRLPLRGARD